MKVAAVVYLKAQYRLDVLLDVAGLARSTFFYHQSRLGRPDKHAVLKAEITSVFSDSFNRYGHRRVHRTLKNKGWRVAKKTILKLMRALGLYCPVRRKRRYVSYQGRSERSHRTCSIVTFVPRSRIRSGSPTSPSSGSVPRRRTCRR